MSGTCFFIGHTEVPDDIFPALASAVAQHMVQFQVKEFIVGQYGKFDALAAAAVRQAKRAHTQIELTLLLPYYRASQALPMGLENTPERFAICRANRYRIAHSTHLIAYARFPAGNAAKFLQYAQARAEKGLLQLVNLAANPK